MKYMRQRLVMYHVCLLTTILIVSIIFFAMVDDFLFIFYFFLLFATNVPIATVMENEMEIHLQTKMMMMMTSSNELDISERNFTFFSLLLYF